MFFSDYPLDGRRSAARWRRSDSSQWGSRHSPASSHRRSPSGSLHTSSPAQCQRPWYPLRIPSDDCSSAPLQPSYSAADSDNHYWLLSALRYLFPLLIGGVPVWAGWSEEAPDIPTFRQLLAPPNLGGETERRTYRRLYLLRSSSNHAQNALNIVTRRITVSPYHKGKSNVKDKESIYIILYINYYLYII